MENRKGVKTAWCVMLWAPVVAKKDSSHEWWQQGALTNKNPPAHVMLKGREGNERNA
jgi:hypothetical protein